MADFCPTFGSSSARNFSPPPMLGTRSVKRRVLAYLEPGERRSTEEIAAATDIEVEDVRPLLSWMRDKGLLEAIATQYGDVRTQVTYWLLTEQGLGEKARQAES